eukprot:scaffold59207_cov66-Phaeocystis_antarctica.AAC.5
MESTKPRCGIGVRRRAASVGRGVSRLVGASLGGCRRRGSASSAASSAAFSSRLPSGGATLPSARSCHLSRG